MSPEEIAVRTWLVKQEPSAYSWEDLVQEGVTAWTGIRNFQARNYLASMTVGDEVLFYHTGGDKCIVGLARVRKSAYPDPTAKEGNWVCVDLEPMRKFVHPISLETVKKQQALQGIRLLRQSRLSVMPITQGEFHAILALGGA